MRDRHSQLPLRPDQSKIGETFQSAGRSYGDLAAPRLGSPGEPDGSPDAVLAAVLAENTQLREALARRELVGQAMGVLMWRYRIGADAALALLRRWSQDSNIKLRTIARALTQLAANKTAGREPDAAHTPERTSGADTWFETDLRSWIDQQLTGYPTEPAPVKPRTEPNRTPNRIHNSRPSSTS